MTRLIRLAVAAAVLSSLPAAAESPRFRGADGSGVFAGESCLMQSWPEGGPKMLWSADGLGESYASVSVAGGRLYTTGKADERGIAFAFKLDGERLWQKDYGTAHSGSGYPGTRTTPTVDGDTLYLLSSMGKAVALDAASGDLRWEVDLFARFGGSNIYFGVSESPLVDDGKVVFTPGGKDAAMVALDKTTGETVWTSKGLNEKAAYCSPRVLDAGGQRQIVTFVEKHLAGLDPATGEVLWRHESKVSYDIHATSPVFDGRSIFLTHGYNQGGKLVELAADGKSVSDVWSTEELDVHHGGAVFLNGHVYGASSKGTWYVLDGKSGEAKASIPKAGKGSVVFADGRLYGYTEAGEVLLVDPNPESFEVVGSFEIVKGDGQHWSHPVVSDNVLYIRHGAVLMAYDVKEPSCEG